MQQEGTAEYIDAKGLTTKVQPAIFSEATLKAAEINLKSIKGVDRRNGFGRYQQGRRGEQRIRAYKMSDTTCRSSNSVVKPARSLGR